MPLTEAQRRANKKYQAKTIASLACRVKKEQAEAFKAYCTIQGRTSNAVLRDYVLGCIGEGSVPEVPQEATGTPASALPPDTIKAAQEAAEAAGESVPAFIDRAIATQAKRDRVFLASGVNPSTGEKLERRSTT